MAVTAALLQFKRHPTAWFFVFAFLISWIGWFLAPNLAPLGPHLVAFVSLVGSYGPAFSAIIISAVVDPEPSDASVTKRRIVFVVVLVVAFLIQLLATYSVGGEIVDQTVLFGLFGAVMAAYVVSCVYHPRRGVAQLFAGLKRVSVRSVWVWIALLLPFVWQFLGALVDFGLGGKELLSLTPTVFAALVAYYPFIVFFGGGLNEEPGWRGFVVPRLQRTLSPLVAGLIIGLVWSAWHFPLHATGVIEGGLVGFGFRFIFNVPLGVLFSWLYNRSKGNLFACVLLHASYNSAGTLFGNGAGLISLALMIAFTVFAAVYDRMWMKEPRQQQSTSSTPLNADGAM